MTGGVGVAEPDDAVVQPGSGRRRFLRGQGSGHITFRDLSAVCGRRPGCGSSLVDRAVHPIERALNCPDGRAAPLRSVSVFPDPPGAPMIILGLVLLVLGLVLKISILYTIGIILLVIGVVLLLLGSAGRAVGGRKHYF